MTLPSAAKNIPLVGLYVITATLVATLFAPDQITFFPPILRTVLVIFASIMLTRYTVYLIIGLAYSQRFWLPRGLPSDENKTYYPLVSVVIPAWNEEVGLLATVQSVLRSAYRNVELIVINDGSTDRSHEIMESFISDYQRTKKAVPVVYRYQPNAGKAKALNHGLSLVRGDIILTIDADSHMDRAAITQFVAAFADPTVMAAVGTVKIGNTDTLWGVIQRLEYVVGFYFKRAESLLKSIHIIGGAAGAFRREVFEKLGPFRADHITEDMELTLRIQRAGLKIVYASQAVVYTEGASTFWGLMQQRLRWKRGRLSALREHRQLFFSRDKRHRRVLSWGILPLVVVGEVTQLLELPFLGALLVYGVLSTDFTPFLMSIAVIACFASIQIIMTEQGRDRWYLLALTPISWWLLAAANYIEASALIRSLWLIISRRSLAWQRWQRVGALQRPVY